MTVPMTDEAFRAEIRAFIAAELPPEMARRALMGYHPHKPDIQFWMKKLHARGWAAPNWSAVHGGTGWPIHRRHIFEEECAMAGCPRVSPQGLRLVGPIIQAVGSERQKRRFLPPILSGDHFWAQGFSEPEAGSDLAALSTRAVRDGDDYVVNGQKIWTSDAHFSDWVFLLVRTSTEGRPQAGISFLLADLKSPGITVRPIPGIEGGHALNQLFLEDVRVPAANLVGEENRGWSYAKQLLGAERSFSAEVPRCKGLLARCRAVATEVSARGRPLIEDPHFSRRLAQLEIEVLAHEATLWRVVAEEEGADINSPTPSILKIKGTELVQRIGALLVEALGDDALPDYPEADYLLDAPADAPGSPLAPGAVFDFLYRRSMTIYGGASEVQRNIIAAQLLGR